MSDRMAAVFERADRDDAIERMVREAAALFDEADRFGRTAFEAEELAAKARRRQEQSRAHALFITAELKKLGVT